MEIPLRIEIVDKEPGRRHFGIHKALGLLTSIRFIPSRHRGAKPLSISGLVQVSEGKVRLDGQTPFTANKRKIIKGGHSRLGGMK